MHSNQSKRAQSDLISWLVLTAISLTIITSVYFWAWPNLQKAQNMDEVMRLENRMLELHTAVKKAASEQAQMVVPFYIKKGTLWLDENNSIRYLAHLKLDQQYYKQAVFGNITELGILGHTEPGYCEQWGAIEFRLHYIFLKDPVSTSKEYTIRLRPGAQTTIGPGEHNVVVKWIGENSSYPDVKTGNNARAQLVEINML